MPNGETFTHLTAREIFELGACPVETLKAVDRLVGRREKRFVDLRDTWKQDITEYPTDSDYRDQITATVLEMCTNELGEVLAESPDDPDEAPQLHEKLKNVPTLPRR